MEPCESSFKKLSAIDVSQHTEQKNGFNYLSWAWAIDMLLSADPKASWCYGEPIKWGNDTLTVVCSVTAFGITRTAYLPVMDFKNRAIPNPDSFQANSAMQRCLVKAIALHGLGLSNYKGEDFKELDDSQFPLSKPRVIPTQKAQTPTSQPVSKQVVDNGICTACGGNLLKSKYDESLYCSNYKKGCKFKVFPESASNTPVPKKIPTATAAAIEDPGIVESMEQVFFSEN